MIYDYKRLLLHIPHGVFNVLVVLITHPSEHTGSTLAWIFAIGFLVFELAEERVLHDKAFHDLVGWLVGIVVGVAILTPIAWFA